MARLSAKKQKELKQLIRKDLKSQLEAQNKHDSYYENLVDDYMYCYQLKMDLQEDINQNGLRLERTSGNGFTTEKPNESVERVLKVNTQMLKILQDLNLQTPQVKDAGSNEDDYL